MADDVEHFLMCLFAICISSVMKCLFKSLVRLEKSDGVLSYGLLVRALNLQLYSPSLSLYFHSLTNIYHRKKFLF